MSSATQDEQVSPDLRVTPLPALKLPTSEEQWAEADAQLLQTIVPAVRLAVTPEEKNSILVEGLYSFFANTCGTKQHKKQTKDQKESNKKHNRALKEVTE